MCRSYSYSGLQANTMDAHGREEEESIAFATGQTDGQSIGSSSPFAIDCLEYSELAK